MIDKLIALTGTYLITVPTTIYDADAPAELIESVLDKVRAAFADAFGGFTEVAAKGGYRAESGDLIVEDVYTVTAYFSEENDQLIIELAEMIKSEMQQESVLIAKNGKVAFI